LTGHFFESVDALCVQGPLWGLVSGGVCRVWRCVCQGIWSVEMWFFSEEADVGGGGVGCGG